VTGQENFVGAWEASLEVIKIYLILPLIDFYYSSESIEPASLQAF